MFPDVNGLIDSQSSIVNEDGFENITLTNDYNPYIDYTQYNLITDKSLYDYSSYENLGTQQTVKYGLNVYSGDSNSQEIIFTNLKWVIFKLYNSTPNNDNLQFNTNLTWLEDYIVFYLEQDYNNNSSSYSIYDSGSEKIIASSKTYWLDAQNIKKIAGSIKDFETGQSEGLIGSNNGCNTGDSGESTQVINRFRGSTFPINQYIAFGIKPGKKLQTITFSYV